MREHPLKAGVQEEGAEVLLQIVRDEEAFVKVRECGGLDVIANTVKNHPFEEGVQIKALGVVANLAKNGT